VCYLSVTQYRLLAESYEFAFGRLFNDIYSLGIQRQMIVGFVSNEWEMASLESVMALFKIQFCHLRGKTEENRNIYWMFHVRNGD
jgi:hypothetical protein